jgi:hypothetical protein
MAAKGGAAAGKLDAADVRRVLVDRGAKLELGGRPTSRG